MKPNWTGVYPAVSNQFNKDFAIDFAENASMANRIGLSKFGL